MNRNVVTKMSRDRNGSDQNGSDQNGQTELAKPNRPDRKVLFRVQIPLYKTAKKQHTSVYRGAKLRNKIAEENILTNFLPILLSVQKYLQFNIESVFHVIMTWPEKPFSV